MLAKHPITGAPIRIIRTEAQISSDNKSLVWVRSSFKRGAAWSRWNTVVTEVDAVGICDTVSAVVLTATANIDAWLPVLPTLFHSDSSALLFAPAAVVDALSARGFEYERTLLWEDLYHNYPYLGETVCASDPVEKVILCCAHVLRIRHVHWNSAVERDALLPGVRAVYDAWVRTCGGVLAPRLDDTADDECVPRTWLIQQYYRPTNLRRAREITTCLERNIACPYIDHILLLNEEELPVPVSPKIQTVVIGHRMTYYDVFQAIKTRVPAGAFAIFANSDIWFNETLKMLWEIPVAERRLFLALLRWEEDGHIFGPRSDSQDTWILAKDAVDFDVTEEDFGFPFGKSGCDNAITLVMMKKRFLVANPAYSIRTMHLHSSNIRTYDPKDVLYKTHYLYVDPTPIHPCFIQRNDVAMPSAAVQAAWSHRPLGRSFARTIGAVLEDDAKTMCTMLRHQGSPWNYVVGEANLWTPPPPNQPLYHFRGGAFVTADGLISRFREIFIGRHALWSAAWESAKQSTLMPSIHVPSLVSIPVYDEKSMKSLSAWVLHYLPRALSVCKLVQDTGAALPEFLVPSLDQLGSFLTDCLWPIRGDRGHIPVTPIMEDVTYYSEDVWAVPPEAGHEFVTAEDIDCLRSLLPPAADGGAGRRPVIAFFVNDDDAAAVCTRKWAEEIMDKVLPRGWTGHFITHTDSAPVRRKALQSADWIVGAGDELDWMWMAPRGAKVIEFMSDTAPRGDHAHLAAAAGLTYVAGIVKREPLEVQKQNALLEVGRAIRKYGFKEMLDLLHASSKITARPRVIVPSGDALKGIWSHSGDTFREMVEIWKERGYVDVVGREDTGYCWWGDVGEVLLYDRPTARWWNDRTPYQMALFGNCAPLGHPARQSVWCFWPRSPRAVEGVVDRVENMLGYSSRPITSLFLGKIENGVQQAVRTKQDWSGCVELFSMPVDSTGKPYPFTQAEYLDKLCHARFGLCLPGFGPKCNREIEYFACGCVPIVTPGVDMRGYLVPPVEGVHYLRADTPEQVKKLVAETDPAKWALMSAAGRAWWRTYASAEGLFRLTWARIEQCRPYFNVGVPKKFI